MTTITTDTSIPTETSGASAAILGKFAPRPDTADPPRNQGSGILYRCERREGGPAADLRVLGIAPDAGACGHYRIKYPLMCLAEQGAAVEVRLATQDLPLDAYLEANVILLSRAYTEDALRGVQAIARLTGAAIVYDLDDCLHAVSPTNPAFPAYDPGNASGQKALDGIRHFLAESDGALFSTRELAGYYERDTRYGHVLFNGLDLTLGERDWDTQRPRFDWRSVAARQGCPVDSESLLFGWAGGSTHHDSLLGLGDAVERILVQTKNTFFGIFTSPALAAHFCVERWRLPMRRVVFLPPVPFQDHPRVLSAFNVGLAPLKNDLFSRCKSPLRLLEYGAWGIPYVASKVAPYWRFHGESGGQGGEIATNADEFVRHTARLLEDRDARQERGQRLQAYVRAEGDVRASAAHLGDTLRMIAQSRREPVRQPPVQAVGDAVRGIPRVDPVGPRAGAPCPCGTGDAYAGCSRGCFPAFGEIAVAAANTVASPVTAGELDGSAEGSGKGQARPENVSCATVSLSDADHAFRVGDDAKHGTVIAATLLCDRKAHDQLAAVPRIFAMHGVIRLYVSVETEGSAEGAADYSPLERFLDGHPTPSLLERWHRTSWQDAFPEEDQDQRRLLGIVTARNMAIDYALGQDADWLLFVDADVLPEPDGLSRLLALGRPLCGGLVPGRDGHEGINYVFPGRMGDPDWDLPVSEEGDVIRCGFGTCGYMLVHWSVFSQLRFRFNPLGRPGAPATAEDPAYCHDAVRLGLADAFYIDRRATAAHQSVSDTAAHQSDSDVDTPAQGEESVVPGETRKQGGIKEEGTSCTTT